MSKCYDNPEYDDSESDIQNTWEHQYRYEQKKESKVMKNIHILQTDKPSRLYEDVDNDLQLGYNFTVRQGMLQNQHIYITSSDEEIKEGDWYFDGTDLVHKKTKYNDALVDGNKDVKKIILTTDQELIKDGVQSIDDEFLEWFVKNPSCEKIETIYGLFNPMGRQVDPMNLGQNHSQCVWKYKIIIPKEEPKTAWVGVLHDKLNEYHPAEYELKDIYQGEGCLPHFPDEELCQIWCDSKYKEEPNWSELENSGLDKPFQLNKQETLEEVAEIFVNNRFTKQICNDKSYPDIYASKEAIVESHILFAKWQMERSYSEEDMKNAFDSAREFNSLDGIVDVHIVLPMGGDMSDLQPLHFTFEEWFEQFKKK